MTDDKTAANKGAVSSEAVAPTETAADYADPPVNAAGMIDSTRLGQASIKSAALTNSLIDRERLAALGATSAVSQITAGMIDSTRLGQAWIKSAALTNSLIDRECLTALGATSAVSQITAGMIDSARLGQASIKSAALTNSLIDRERLAALGATSAVSQITAGMIDSARLGQASIKSAALTNSLIDRERLAALGATSAVSQITAGMIDSARLGQASIKSAALTNGFIDRERLTALGATSAVSQITAGMIDSTRLGQASIIDANRLSLASFFDSNFAKISESIRAYDAFAHVNEIISKQNSYDNIPSAYLREVLGDWRNDIAWDNIAAQNVEARSVFYHQQGVTLQFDRYRDEDFDRGLDAIDGNSEADKLIVLLGNDLLADNVDAEKSQLSRNAEAYRWLYSFEVMIRKFVSDNMHKQYGPNWYKGRLPNGLYDEWYRKQSDSVNQSPKKTSLIDFADFNDYQLIICKKDNFRELFGHFFISPESVRESFQRLRLPRNETMHARRLSNEDMLLMYSEIKRLTVAMKKEFH